MDILGYKWISEKRWLMIKFVVYFFRNSHEPKPWTVFRWKHLKSSTIYPKGSMSNLKMACWTQFTLMRRKITTCRKEYSSYAKSILTQILRFKMIHVSSNHIHSSYEFKSLIKISWLALNFYSLFQYYMYLRIYNVPLIMNIPA